jgi:wyosine [tRNA(Phe)-imidazoG37] synthetase (radical SAM superfamily)
MEHVYGPVPSRRLGRSLGIDTVRPKTCNWNCVYCQLGRSTPVVNARGEHVPRDRVIAEVAEALRRSHPGDIDWITFVASGETTLHGGLGWMIDRVKAMTDLPVAVITNGSLLSDAEVRRELLACDAVMPSLDAGSSALYRRLNRPHPDLTFGSHVDGLVAFRREFHGKLWIEVMMVRGENDTERALIDLRTSLDRIEPDETHLVAPTRSPVEPWVRPTGEQGAMRALAILGPSVRIIPPSDVTTALVQSDSVVDALVAVVTRHPMSQRQLVEALPRWAPGRADQILAKLGDDPRVQLVRRHGALFWCGTGPRYPAA